MFYSLIHKDKLTAVFQKYTNEQAVQVKANIALVMESLNIPSPALLYQMKAEGFTFDEGGVNNQNQKFSVAKRTISEIFLDQVKLQEAVDMLSIGESIQLKKIWLETMFNLNRGSSSYSKNRLQQQTLDQIQKRLQKALENKVNAVDAQADHEAMQFKAVVAKVKLELEKKKVTPLVVNNVTNIHPVIPKILLKQG